MLWWTQANVPELYLQAAFPDPGALLYFQCKVHISRPLVNIFRHSCTFSGPGCTFSYPRRTFSGAHFWAPGPHFQGHVADIFLLDIINQTEYPPFKRNQLAEGARPRWTPRCGIVWERSEECHPRRPPPALHWYHTGLRIMSPPHRPRVPQTPRKTLIHINRDSLLSFETPARLPSPNSKLNKSLKSTRIRCSSETIPRSLFGANNDQSDYESSLSVRTLCHPCNIGAPTTRTRDCRKHGRWKQWLGSYIG